MTGPSARHPHSHDLYPNQIFKGFPTAEETVELLEAWQDALVRRHLGIRQPEDLSDTEYRSALARAREEEYGSRPRPWDEKEPEDEDPWTVAATLLDHLDFVDGDAVARLWWWERNRWLERSHPRRARTVNRALTRRRSHA